MNQWEKAFVCECVVCECVCIFVYDIFIRKDETDQTLW